MGEPEMARKQASKRKRRGKAVPVLGAAGLSLSLASGASAATSGSTADMLTRNTGVSHQITLCVEEIFDVSLATFYVFDKENAGTFRRGARLAAAAARRPPITERRRSGAVLIRRITGSCPRPNIRRRLSASTFRKTHKTHDCAGAPSTSAASMR